MVILTLTFVLTAALITFGCGKKQNPLAPGDYSPDVPQPTATPSVITPGMATVIVKTVFGNDPISNVTANLAFVSMNPTSKQTDATGTTTFVLDAEGTFGVTIPGQGDLMESKLTGHCSRSDATTVVFQAGGEIRVTPTAINYDFAGGDFNIIVTLDEGANALHTNLVTSLLNMPPAWSAVFADSTIVDGGSTTLTVSVPSGSSENAMDMKVRGLAQSGAIQINSNNLAIYRDWVEFADIKVIVMNGAVPMPGINFTVTDSGGTPYNDTTQADGSQTVRIFKTGNFSIAVPAQGYLASNGWADTVSQGQLYEHTFQVGSADLAITVQHQGTAYNNIPVTIKDNNGVVQKLNTDGFGSINCHLNAIGNYTVSLDWNPTNGIAGGTRAGTINQNQNFNVNFTGQRGSLGLSSSAIGYIFSPTQYHNFVTYTGTGDIIYIVTLYHEPYLMPLGSDNALNQGFGQPQIITSQNTNSTLETRFKGYNVNHSDFKIKGNKQGQNNFDLFSDTYSFSRGWYLTISLSPSWNEMYKYNDTPPHFRCDWSYTVTGVNMPAGTLVLPLIHSYSMPQTAYLGVPGYPPEHEAIPSTGSVMTGSSGNFSIFGYSRGGGVPWKYDGVCQVVVNFYGIGFASEVRGFKY